MGTLQIVALGRYGEFRDGPPLLAVQARGALDRYRSVLESVSSTADPWSGWAASAYWFGPVVGPLAAELRRVGLLAAPTGPATLLLTLDPDGDSTAIEWSTARPGHWHRRIVRAGVDLDAEDLRRAWPVPSVAATARPSPVTNWSEDDLVATLAARCRLAGLVERGHLGREQHDRLLERLGRLRDAGRPRPLTTPGGPRP